MYHSSLSISWLTRFVMAQKDIVKVLDKKVTMWPKFFLVTNFAGHKQLRPILASVSIVRTNTLGKKSFPLAS